MVVIGDSLLIVIRELGFSFYEVFSHSETHKNIISLFFPLLSFFIKPVHYFEQRRPKEIIVIAILYEQKFAASAE